MIRLDKRTDDALVMDALLEEKPVTEIHEGDLIEGTILSIEGAEVFVDLGEHGTGIIFGREFMNAKNITKNLAPGELVKSKIVETENEDGYVELSLKEARQALLWGEAEKLMNEKTPLALVIKEANKGGLLVEWQGIPGFLPASQLKEDNYPRVEDGDKDAILKELKNFVGKTLTITIISTNPKEGKLIFSEKGSQVSKRKEILTKYVIGEEVETIVTGIVDFGIFLKVEDGLEGLVHISEIDWSLVDDPRKLYSVNDNVRAKVIGVSNDKISLSIKQLKPNPWNSAKDKYQKDMEVKGVVIKYNKHGALVAIEEGVAGLIHVSEFPSEKDLRETLELGKSYDFTITLFDATEQRMTLVTKKAA